MSQLKVLICGGGIAGNALAFWLSKSNHDVTVLERFPDLRSSGLQLDLRGHGVDVLRRMGLEEAFREKAVKEEGIEFVDSYGKVRAYFAANKSGQGRQSFSSDFEIMRGDLVRLLYDATKDRTKYVFGVSVLSIEQHEGSIIVRFTNGQVEKFDLLVGADGQNSRTRKMMLGSNVADPIKHLDLCMSYFTIPQQVQNGEQYRATSYIAPGKRYIMTRRSKSHQVQVYLGCEGYLDNISKGDVEAEKMAFAEAFRNAGWKTTEILKGMNQADDFYCERPGVVKLHTWSSGSVVLLGDAAYCPTFMTGMGTTSAMVGAYILAGEIEKYCGRSGEGLNSVNDQRRDALSTALKEYESKFRPFMDQVQKGVADDGFDWSSLIPSSAWGIAVLNVVISILAFLRIDVLAKWVLREDVIDWALPEYEDKGFEKWGKT